MTARRYAPNIPAMDPIAAALCGAGAVWIMTGVHGASLMDLFVAAGAFYGISRVTRSRAVLGLLGVLVVVWFLDHFWTLVPTKLFSVGFGAENAKHHDAPDWWAGVFMHGALLVSVILARAKVGRGLTVLTIVAFAIALLSKFASTLWDMGRLEHEETLIGAIASGWSGVSIWLAASSWLVVGLGPPPGPPISRRVTPILGAVGSLLIAATLGVHLRDVSVLVVLATMFVAWVLSAIGLGGLARAGAGAPAWVGMAFVIAQLVLGFPLGFFAFNRLMDSNFPDVVGMTMLLGLSGFGIAAIAARALPYGAVRGLIGILFLVGAAGAVLALFTVLMGSRDVDDPFWPLRDLMVPATSVALTLWAAYLAYVAFPPEPSAA